MEPVSSNDFRLEMTFGQPPDTASISFEDSRSTVWVMESLTADPLGSSSIVQSDGPSAFSSGLFWCCQRITRRLGGLASTISPESQTTPFSPTSFHDDPVRNSLWACMPNQYCLMKSASVKAFHSFSGVVRM